MHSVLCVATFKAVVAAYFYALLMHVPCSLDLTTAFTVSLELQGGSCSVQLTFICRHNDILSDPNWIHNGTAEGGQLLATAFPGMTMYSFQSRTEHRVTVAGVDDVTALDGYVFQCVYSIQGTPIKSNTVQYSFIPNGQSQFMHVVNVHRIMLCRCMCMPCMHVLVLLTAFVDIIGTYRFSSKADDRQCFPVIQWELLHFKLYCGRLHRRDSQVPQLYQSVHCELQHYASC